MRFIGLEKQVSIEYIRENENFKNRRDVQAWQSEEYRKTERAMNYANRTQDVPDDTMVSMVMFFTCYGGSKWLTYWVNDFEICLRAVEIEPLSKSEKLKHSKVKFPVQIHRRKPIKGSFFGASIADEVL
jgi:hypothetical protein